MPTQDTRPAPTSATLTVTHVPELAQVFHYRREALAMHAQAFGLETVACGLNSAEDMPNNDAYTRAAGAGLVLLGYMERDEPLSMALLVNILADHAGPS